MSRALLIIDVQIGVCTSATFFNQSELINRVNQRIKQYREQKLPIIFIQHEDDELIYQSDDWQLMDALEAQQHDFYVRKTHANSFYQTELQHILKELGVTSLEVLGAQTQYCVDTTIKFAHGLGYRLFSIPSGTSTTDNEWMTAKETVTFYENIWKNRFVYFWEEE